MDAKKIICEKLLATRKIQQGEFICEDTSIYLDCLNGFPSPLIKWLLQLQKVEGIYSLVDKYKNYNVLAKTIVGYTDRNLVEYFEGKLEGKIVSPRGKRDFGWDPIFQPKGFNKTLTEMTLDEKNQISMRRKAFEKLKNYLDSCKK
ncbi:non-canonical purine NTP pyrophosphatase [Candidatus Pacearchaeota archaeon]|nr:non-canonical purine NTP pyrophosphatase [Candidatus Pacearchaeota archaeon]